MIQKTAIIYLRVSSVQQARRELPVESQLQHAQAKAKELGAVVVAIFTDAGISGRTAKRADFQASIAYCEEHKPDYFIAWDTARFARNRIDAALYKRELRKHGTDVVYVSMSIDTKTDEGWFVEALLEVMDESTSRRISKDTKRSMVKNAEEGYFNGGRVPFGYQTVAAEGSRKRVAILELEAVIVRQMFDMCGRGMGALSIAVALNGGGTLNRGHRWVKSTVINMLKNHAYAGYTIFNKRKHHSRELQPEANWIRTKSRPAIIEETIFMAIQEQITARAPVLGSGSPKSGHLFTGMLKCSCGCAMHIESASGRNKQYFYYRCGDAKSGGSCPGRRISAPAIDDFLAKTILNRILTPARVSEIIHEIEKATGNWWKDRELKREAIVAEIRDAEKKRRNLFSVLELHGKDAPNLGDITVRLREIKAQVETLERNMVTLESTQDPDLDISQDDIAEATEAIREMVTSCDDPKTVRTFFGSFVNKVMIDAELVTIEYDPAKIMNHGVSVVHSQNIWLPEQVLLRTVKLRVKLPPPLRKKLLEPVAPACAA